MLKIKSKKTLIILCTVIPVIVLTLGVFFLKKLPKTPEYDPLKYNSTIHTVLGGQIQENANVNSITLEKAENALNVNFEFVSGSVIDENVAECGIPEYKVEFLSSPLRLKVSFLAVYWDYMVTGMPEDETGLINGMFQMSPQKSGDNVVLYFSLTKNVEFKVVENEDKLTVSLLPEETENDETKWYIVSDLYYEYQAGQMVESDFTPMLCDDKISVIMISKAYESEDAAKEAMENLLASAFEGKKMRVVALKENELPNYSDSADTQALLSESVLSIDGAKTTLPLFYADARFLCWAPDNSGALFAKNENGAEKLYIADKNGTKHLLCEQEFSTVVEAVYSSDGSRIAFIEQAEEASLVTVVDVNSGKITVVNDENNPWGEFILGVQFNGNGTKLYCLSGNASYSIKTYDFATGGVTILKDNIFLESNLKYSSGYLYYCDIVNEYEAVMRISISGGDPEIIHKGSQFTLSPDGKRVAVIVEDYETAVCDLRVVDVETKTSETVLGDIVTSEFFFTSDSEKIFYLLETGDPEYYYQLMRYDINTRETFTMAQCINSVVYASDKPEEIIISVIYEGENGAMPVTYIADFDKMVVGETEEGEF